MKTKKARLLSVWAISFFALCSVPASSRSHPEPSSAPGAKATQPLTDSSGIVANAPGDPNENLSKSSCNGSSVPAKDALGLTKVIILIGNADDPSYRKVAKAVLDLGGRITVGLPPESILALIPIGQEYELEDLPEVLLAASQPVPIQSFPHLSERQEKLLESWNRRMSKPPASPSSQEALPPPPNDAREKPPLAPGETLEIHPPRVISGSAIAGGFASGQNRSFGMLPAPSGPMSGLVAVTVFFPESNGAIDANRENWTSTQLNTVISEIAIGLDWWATVAPVSANLSFSSILWDNPSTQPCLQTSYEPITRSSSDECLWIDQIMSCYGYASGSCIEKVDSYDTWRKANAGADNAFSIFVVNDKVDPDNAFSDGYFAYAYIGGPFVVMTYDNDGWGIDNMDSVITHETGHIFWAWDEYYQPGYATCSCSSSSYGCSNRNCDNSCQFSLPCIMKSGSASDLPCDCTRGQIGWSCGCCDPANFGNPCDDGQYCTKNDICTGGACVGSAQTCSDGNECTNDVCDETAHTCTNVNNKKSCSDGLYCTADDVCSNGSCQAGPPRNCDDGNPCTQDACDDTLDQCKHDPLSGLSCDIGKVCQSGKCVSSGGGGGGGGGSGGGGGGGCGSCSIAAGDLTPEARAFNGLFYLLPLVIALGVRRWKSRGAF